VPIATTARDERLRVIVFKMSPRQIKIIIKHIRGTTLETKK
jgi:hypothetical protein